jgi:hypothetical protein
MRLEGEKKWDVALYFGCLVYLCQSSFFWLFFGVNTWHRVSESYGRSRWTASATSKGEVGSCQLRPERLEWNHRRDRHKWIVLFGETFVAWVKIEETKLCPTPTSCARRLALFNLIYTPLGRGKF